MDGICHLVNSEERGREKYYENWYYSAKRIMLRATFNKFNDHEQMASCKQGNLPVQTNRLVMTRWKRNHFSKQALTFRYDNLHTVYVFLRVLSWHHTDNGYIMVRSLTPSPKTVVQYLHSLLKDVAATSCSPFVFFNQMLPQILLNK